jgi:N-carbamoyl-L-amino-acid hydrolase
MGCLGSKTFCNGLPPGVMAFANEHGVTLGQALHDAGLQATAPARLDHQRHAAYLEAHIEQGPYLEELGNRIGIVTSIVGSRNLRVEFRGQQNHAGTTPMPRRRDAVKALVEFSAAVFREFPGHADEFTVWTIGEISIEPGAISIVPGFASLNLQFRDQDVAVLDRLETLARALVEQVNRDSPVEISVDVAEIGAMPADMDPTLRTHLEHAAKLHAPDEWISMPSAAVHDAQVLAQHIPSAMLFVPSIGGVSHAFEEDTGDEDLVLGCQVMATAAAAIARTLGG